MANERTLSLCPYKVVIHSYGDSDCHILIILSPPTLTIFEFGNMFNLLTSIVCPYKVVIHS